ncbi:MAG: tRNA (adenosine(37)-N6)-threonylcarbamoyltransferase complex dimerization subunit type 1 TsaB [Gemmataceae bacterium]|nr:tRNA (adenosine(37)-N6)-threonylcarbamoyltransferase complex dimerization subunit type 1 TsaB [Gemmataceae bacterium]
MAAMSENWLIVETSGRAGAVGLARAGAVVRTHALDEARRHARDLAAAAGGLLGAEGLKPADVGGVTVSVGPGSYTGLRVGVMSAKAFAYATGGWLVPVPTFAAIVERAPADAEDVWVVADALQGQVYVQRFVLPSDRHDTVPQPGWTPADDLRIEAAKDALAGAAAGAWVTGPGVGVLAGYIPEGCRVVPEADRLPTVESLWAAGRAVQPIDRRELLGLEPLYLRGSSAEEKRKREPPRG